MEDWQKLLLASATTCSALDGRFPVDTTALERVTAVYPMRINPYYLGLIRHHDDPLGRQAIPDVRELTDTVCIADPLAEDRLSPVPLIVHKYPDRVLFLVSNQCAVYCRFCTRKRLVGTAAMRITDELLHQGIDYIRRHPAIREVLVSGGDPLLLPDDRIDDLLAALRAIPTVEIIRIGSRVPCTLPMRITAELTAILKKYHPLYINTHFNHPAEVTAAAAAACTRLADAGIPLGSQTVLLRGVNDDVETIRTLMRALLRIRVKPYYLFQADLTRGTNHFRTPVRTGIEIMRGLYGHLSGMAVPTFALDAPGGKGKIPLTPQYVLEHGASLVFANYRGETCTYPESGDPC
ncbi:MAG: KamA family radical SAM protein [Desulfoprunum sp.]|jgi:lysine 2,3-aminomutase